MLALKPGKFHSDRHASRMNAKTIFFKMSVLLYGELLHAALLAEKLLPVIWLLLVLFG